MHVIDADAVGRGPVVVSAVFTARPADATMSRGNAQ